MQDCDIKMTPKKIHYCWFGHGPKPELAVKCIESWRKFLPDYEIIEWNEDNFDVNEIPYTAQAYAAKKYAFVSDYARFKILYEHGGLYFDTDVEIIRPMDDIIAAGPFMGCECAATPGATPNELGVAPGLGLGVNPGLGLYAELIDAYRQRDFGATGETVVTITTDLLCQYGLKNMPVIQQVAGINIYPNDYFCPINYETGEMQITEHTRSIHHYSGSWLTKKDIAVKFMNRNGMSWLVDIFVEVKHRLQKIHS